MAERTPGTSGHSESSPVAVRTGDTVLVVEDEQKIRDLLRAYLQREGYDVVSTASGAEAIALVERVHPDLLLLDLRLADVSGEEVAREVRQTSRTPIVMLTAKSGVDERVHGLELGADDYVTKPFSPRELMLRVRAVLRRARPAEILPSTQSFSDGELVIDPERHEVAVRGDTVELTRTEWQLLTTLAATPGRVYSRYELVNRVGGYEYEGYERIIDSHIKNLRRTPPRAAASASSYARWVSRPRCA